MRSDAVKAGPQRGPHRSLLKATGLTDADIRRPLIAIASSHADVVPGHVHLDAVAEFVKARVHAAGGTALIFNTIAICDGIAMGHVGMKYSLPSRELIADCVESMCAAHAFDAMVCVTNCDKIVPGMFMAALRVNVPTVFVSGGPMEAGRVAGRDVDLIDQFYAVAEQTVGAMSARQARQYENNTCPTCGSCSGMFTANSMNCLSEAIGMALPGNGTCLATSPARTAIYAAAAERIVKMAKQWARAGCRKTYPLLPRRIMNKKAFENAFTLDMAMGGSSNTVLHLLAMASEAGLKFSWSLRSGKLCPAARKMYREGWKATGRSVADVKAMLRGAKPRKLPVKNAARLDPRDVIRTLDRAFTSEGGLVILHGNIARNGAVVKQAGLEESMYRFVGRAVICESQEDACRIILAGKVKAGDVVVIRNEGPRGGPGMQEMLAPTSYIRGLGPYEKCFLITDGRFSGGTSGPAIGHIAPEAAAGGEIGLLKNGDVIEIDIPAGRLSAKVSRAEFARRRKRYRPRPPQITHGALGRYAAYATSADTGAVLDWPGKTTG